MPSLDLIGLHEVATLAGVTPSAVANWRKRFADFPSPIADLKAGPIFQGGQVRYWLAKHKGPELSGAALFYDQLAAKRGDDPELIAKIEEAARLLDENDTSLGKPGMLLGKIQSGKTRAFLGIIARCFDRGYGVAVILTKNSVSLARQTLIRVKEDFQELIAAEEVQAEDIMSLPNLEQYELNKKLILVVKKEDDNLDRLLDAFENKHPQLRTKRTLIVDDEADYASVSAQRKNGIVLPGRISQQIDRLRELVVESDFLQVTATPYSLYLQPDDDSLSSCLFTPKRPTFTVSLPTHSKYIGGDYYFERSTDPESPAYYFYREVPVEEREALKKEDRRRLRIENVLSEKRAEVLRDATLTFVAGGVIRRIQDEARGQRPDKYSFLIHTERSRSAHDWQLRVSSAIRSALIEEAENDTPRFNSLLHAAYADVKRSIELDQDALMPEFDEVKKGVVNALTGGELMITRVNSDQDVKELLADDGQLRLRTPLNIFIGGQILDRGITVSNLIAFYYGRNPQKFQQDTVLQHSRMYGARAKADLDVTRFYAPQHVYNIMRNIHELDAALRTAFETGAHDRGVYFIQRDAENRVVPCSPNKLMFSDVVSIRPGRRLLPIGFQTVAKTNGNKKLLELDKKVDSITPPGESLPVLVDIETASELLGLAYENLEFEAAGDDDRKAHLAALEHLSLTSSNPSLRGKVWLLAARDRNVRRYREEGRFSNGPDTKQQADVLGDRVADIPALMLFRQNGLEEAGWRGLPFWWPVIVTPRSAVTSIFAADEPASV